MAIVLPPGESQFRDGDDVPYAGGQLAHYVPATLTPKDTYQNVEQTTLNENPITLDAAGRALIWGSGSYRQILTVGGVEIFDREVTALC